MSSPHSLSSVKPEPGSLVVFGFSDETGAFALRDLLSELEEDGVIEIGDVVVATRNSKGKVRLHQSLPLISGRMLVGSFTGLVLGMALLNPLFGVIAGAGAGAISGAFGDVGIDDAFMKKLGETLAPGTSALFVIVGRRRREEMENRLRPFAGKCKILQTSLPAENEARVRQFMAGEPSLSQQSPI